jgi:hypothetical protein
MISQQHTRILRSNINRGFPFVFRGSDVSDGGRRVVEEIQENKSFDAEIRERFSSSSCIIHSCFVVYVGHVLGKKLPAIPVLTISLEDFESCRTLFTLSENCGFRSLYFSTHFLSSFVLCPRHIDNI